MPSSRLLWDLDQLVSGSLKSLALEQQKKSKQIGRGRLSGRTGHLDCVHWTLSPEASMQSQPGCDIQGRDLGCGSGLPLAILYQRLSWFHCGFLFSGGTKTLGGGVHACS